MATYSIAQAKDQLSKLVDEVLDGKDVTITRHGRPVVEMRPAAKPSSKPVTDEDLDWLRKARESLPELEVDTVAIIREMRGHID